jgi:hypothetical protein
MRRRPHWLELATLLGAIAPFLPFVEFFRELSLVDCLIERVPPDASIMLVPPAFLPMFVMAWAWWRRRSSNAPPTLPVVARLFAVAAMISSIAGTVGMQGLLSEFSDLGWAAAFFLPIAANLGLWWWNHRRQLPADTTTEMLLLGTYVATTLPWALVFLAEGALIGAWLIAVVSVAYLAAIVMGLGETHRLDIPLR